MKGMMLFHKLKRFLIIMQSVYICEIRGIITFIHQKRQHFIENRCRTGSKSFYQPLMNT